MESLVFPFDAKHDRPPEELADLLGGKGAGLARMSVAGIPVPPGFTLTTDACRRYLESGWNPRHDEAVREGISGLEEASGKRLGDPIRPLLVSVRSGASASMPGMMDTVLDVGMSDEVESALAAETGDPAFASDTHRRALMSYAKVVSEASDEVIEQAEAARDPRAVRQTFSDAGIVVPAAPIDQIVTAVRAVCESWNSDRARRYREIEGIDSSKGTAATVQAMVFGNLGADSGTGVAFTRDPSSGVPGLMGDFLVGAQGEDVVAGDHPTRSLGEMETLWPEAWAELERIAAKLEIDYADMVDIEFTVERGVLWMLQVRRAKRSPLAAVRVATQMADDPDFPLLRHEAVRRCLPQLEDPPVVSIAGTDTDTDADVVVIGSGLGAAPGRAVGVLCLDVERAVELEGSGVDVILARPETAPSDVAGIATSRGLVTTLGGLVSHAAVVARAWGLPTVVGAAELTLEVASLTGPGGRVEVGTIVTVDGDGGRLLAGSHPLEGHVAPEVSRLRQWQADALTDGAPQTSGLRAPTDEVRADDFSLLHALVIKGMADTPAVARMIGAADDDVSEGLADLVGRGLARHIEARDFYQLAEEGREAHGRLLAEVTGPLDLAPLQYDKFLVTNVRFKELCTDWQLRDGAPNDHADDVYDQDVIRQLVDVDRATAPLLASFAETIPWFGGYRDRLAGARDRLLSGDPKAFTGVMCDSYHDIWMELHEDLLLTQGISRAAEESG